MAHWLHKLDLKDIWNKYNEEMTIQEIGKEVSKRIKELECYEAQIDILEEIAEGFKYVEDVEEFDNWMNELYDWGDIQIGKKPGIIQNKMCWIATNF